MERLIIEQTYSESKCKVFATMGQLRPLSASHYFTHTQLPLGVFHNVADVINAFAFKHQA